MCNDDGIAGRKLIHELRVMPLNGRSAATQSSHPLLYHCFKGGLFRSTIFCGWWWHAICCSFCLGAFFPVDNKMNSFYLLFQKIQKKILLLGRSIVPFESKLLLRCSTHCSKKNFDVQTLPKLAKIAKNFISNNFMFMYMFRLNFFLTCSNQISGLCYSVKTHFLLDLRRYI